MNSNTDMENKNTILKVVTITIVVASIVAIVVFTQAMWGGPTYGWGSEANWWGGMMGGCPMMGWWGGIANVNDSNVGEYVKQRTGYDVISIEKYSNSYYVIIGIGEKPQYEILVFPNGFIHPEPQSMMWYGAPMRITEEEARSIAERWLAKYFPGAEIEEAYVFPGYYTFHFKIGGDMQMLSVNGYNGAVWFHSWHGKYLGEVEG
ncbi:TPA: hypothetical protein HA333_07445 [Pyrobaculum aerophilum]|nr:hypothetical protein [Pyrobaculum aerophilum]